MSGSKHALLPALLLTLGLWSGCATKPVATVAFDPYTPKVAAFKKCGTIFISGISDKRKEKSVVGKILKDGKPVTVVMTDQDMTRWFKNAIESGLKKEGCEITEKETHHPKVARVYLRIDKIEATLDRDKLTGENLEASVQVTLFMRQGGSERIIKKIAMTQRKWVPPLSSDNTVREYLQETLATVVDMVIEHIDSYRF